MIMPSLPGYGFSEASHKKFMSTVEMSQIFIKLMERLGHKKFFVMGADWGAFIITDIARMTPQK